MSSPTQPPVRSLAIVVNADKPGTQSLAEHLHTTAAGLGVECKRTERFPLTKEFLAEVDLCCVLGGDGTLLGVVAAAALSATPVMGVNYGKLGFMTTYSVAEIQTHFAAILRGEFALSQRHLLDCTTSDGSTHLALNDVVLKSYAARMDRFTVHLNGALVNHFVGDGLLFTTPTGSTAYNLSAGGPIIDPSAKAYAMTPICPHTLSNRSIVFSENARLTVEAPDPGKDLLLSIDGRSAAKARDALPMQIQVSEHTLQLVQHHNYSHFALVREKLQWSHKSDSR